MFTFFNDDEETALQGLPLIAQVVYMRGIRRFMDGSTGIVGIKRKISYQSLIETVYVEPMQGRKHENKATIKKMRVVIKNLEDAGLIESKSKDRQLIFLCILATKNNSVQNKQGRGRAEEGQSKEGRTETSDTVAYIEKQDRGRAEVTTEKKGIHQIVNLSNVSKEKYIKRKIDDFELPDFINPDLWKEWLNVRKQKKAVNSPTALKSLISNLEKCEAQNIQASDAMTLAIEQSWKTIKPEWVKNYHASTQRNKSEGVSRAEIESTDFF